MTRIQIENFAPVTKADIELKPFTIFVGHNNSGKSYTAKLIKLLFDSINVGFADMLVRDGMFQMCSEFIGGVARERIFQYFGVKNLNEIIRDGMQSSHVSIQVPNVVDFSFTIEGNEFIVEMCQVSDKYIDYFASEVPLAHYIPSSRTALVKYSTSLAENEQERTSFMDAVTSGFLFSLLYPIRVGKGGKISDVAEKIEKMINGKVVLKEEGDIPSIEYIQKDKAINIRHASSSVISLASLAIFIRHNLSEESLLIVEEPELHLHQSLIPMLGNVFASLVNMGVRVLIVTNNYIFPLTINKLIEAKTNEKIKEELGISDDEVLDKENVGAYVFSKGVVERLELSSFKL